jgi:SecD/SecF fusion protein
VIYISIRFEFAYAIASIIALIHDVIIATGIFVLLGGEVSLPVIAALLTIIGYSLNDTIVVFDRIREDLKLVKDRTYKEIINLSINQTLSRTMLTSLTTLLVLLVLLIFGGIAINDFVLVMLLGVIIGTYSSIFIASPVVAVWHHKIGAKAKTEEDKPVVTVE